MFISVHLDNSDPFKTVKVTSLKYDPNSFDPKAVNKFAKSKIEVILAEGDAVSIDLAELVDPYDAEEFAETAMRHIETLERKKHVAQSSFKDLIKKFT